MKDSDKIIDSEKGFFEQKNKIECLKNVRALRKTCSFCKR